jgi:uncharacterized delta-60 repeat protein
MLYSQNENYLDSTFDEDGWMQFNQNCTDRTHSIAVQSDDKILVAGYGSSPNYEVFIFRVNPDGTRDTTFADNGIFIYSPDTLIQTYLPHILITESNKILFIAQVVEGISTQNITNRLKVFCLNSDGSIDLSYGENGIVNISDIGFGSNIADQKMSPAQELYFVLDKYIVDSYHSEIFKISQDGSVVEEFGETVISLIDQLYDANHISQLFFFQDTLLCIGTSYINWDYQRFLTVWKLEPTSGELITDFGNGGLFELNYNQIPSPSLGPRDVCRLIQGDFLILLGGNTSALVRINSNGLLDSEFGINGIQQFAYNLSCNRFNQLLINPQGQLFVFGYSDYFCQKESVYFYHIAQLSEEGEPILMNTSDGIIENEQFFYDEGVAQFQSDGKLIVVGSYITSGLDFIVSRLDFQDVVNDVEELIPYEQKLSVYPNPASGSAWLHYPIEADGNATIPVYDPQGRLMNSFQPNTHGLVELSLKNYESGMYVVQLIAFDKVVESIKLNVVNQ